MKSQNIKMCFLVVCALGSLAISGCSQQPDCTLGSYAMQSVRCQRELMRLEAERERIEVQQEWGRAIRDTASWLVALVLLACAVTITAVLGTGAWVYYQDNASAWGRGFRQQKLQARVTIRVAQARYSQRLPDAPRTLTISPRHYNRPAMGAVTQAALESEAEVLHVKHPALPSGYDTLVDAGVIAGYEPATASPVKTSLERLNNIAIGGAGDSGKTSLAAAIISQLILEQAREHKRPQLWLFDNHGGTEKGVAAALRYMPDDYFGSINESTQHDGTRIMRRYYSGEDSLEGIRLVRSILSGRASGDPDRSLVLVAIDELGAFQRLGSATYKKISEFVQHIAEEGRGLGVVCVVSSHIWKSTLGDWRSIMQTCFVKRQRASDARLLTGLPQAQLPVDPLELKKSECLVVNPDIETRKLELPYITANDIGLAFAKLKPPVPEPIPADVVTPSASDIIMQPAEPTPDQEVTRYEPNPKPREARPTTQKPRIAQDAAALTAFYTQGRSISQVARSVYGRRSGASYLEACDRVMSLIREYPPEVFHVKHQGLADFDPVARAMLYHTLVEGRNYREVVEAACRYEGVPVKGAPRNARVSRLQNGLRGVSAAAFEAPDVAELEIADLGVRA